MPFPCPPSSVFPQAPILRPVELTSVEYPDSIKGEFPGQPPPPVTTFHGALCAMRRAADCCTLLGNQAGLIKHSACLRATLLVDLFTRILPLPLAIKQQVDCSLFSTGHRVVTQASASLPNGLLLPVVCMPLPRCAVLPCDQFAPPPRSPSPLLFRIFVRTSPACLFLVPAQICSCSFPPIPLVCTIMPDGPLSPCLVCVLQGSWLSSGRTFTHVPERMTLFKPLVIPARCLLLGATTPLQQLLSFLSGQALTLSGSALQAASKCFWASQPIQRSDQVTPALLSSPVCCRDCLL